MTGEKKMVTKMNTKTNWLRYEIMLQLKINKQQYRATQKILEHINVREDKLNKIE